MHYWVIYPFGVSVVFHASGRQDPDEHLDSLVYVVAVFARTLCLRPGWR